MYQAIFWLRQRLALFRGQEVFHFLWRNLNALIDVAALYPLQYHLPSYLLAHLDVGLALCFELLAKLVEIHPVLPGNPLQGIIELGIADTHAHSRAFLNLDTLKNQAVQGFSDQLVFRWQFYAPGFEALVYGGQSLAQLAGHNHIVIDDGNHLVQDLRGRASHRDESDSGCQAQCQ